jgi:precorrin-8X/cobalt-precorrin-8 methylmutase
VRLFDSYLVVDWSAASVPRTGPDSIWLALVRGEGGLVLLENPPTRTGAAARLAELLAAERAAGRRVLAGFDFPFGWPLGMAERLFGAPGWRAVWEGLAARIEDGAANANNRFAVAAALNAAGARFWGLPNGREVPGLPARKPAFGDVAEFRAIETYAHARGARPKSVWQLNGAGSVGGQALTGIATLEGLRRDPRLEGAIAVWPFETGFARGAAPIVLAEVYPSLWSPHPDEAVKDAGQVRAAAERFAALDAAGGLGALLAGPADAAPAERAAALAEEAWILGMGARAAPPPRALRYLKDPAAIYAESFRVVAEEARLDRFPEALRDAVARVVHACGMPEVADRLAFSPDAGAAGRAALAAGAPVLCDCEMVAAGLIRRRLAGSEVVVTLNDPSVPARAAAAGTTRSAAAVDLWQDRIAGAVVAIGNAPTALFHLLERLDAGWPRPALILGFPVGFVGAAEAKAELARDPRGVPFLTLRGRRGGSAMAAAAVNALAPGEAA